MARNRLRTDQKADICIVPLGQVPSLAVSIVAANIQTVVGLNSKILPPFPNPEYAFVSLRGQYLAGKILAALESVENETILKLGLVQCDLCTPILKFVFGNSQLGGKAAVVSLFRLGSDEPGGMYLRAAKIAIHETGHMLGLGHCHVRDCLMAFSSTPERVDSLPLRFCPACKYEVARCLRHYLGGV